MFHYIYIYVPFSHLKYVFCLRSQQSCFFPSEQIWLTPTVFLYKMRRRHFPSFWWSMCLNRKLNMLYKYFRVEQCINLVTPFKRFCCVFVLFIVFAYGYLVLKNKHHKNECDWWKSFLLPWKNSSSLMIHYKKRRKTATFTNKTTYSFARAC